MFYYAISSGEYSDYDVDYFLSYDIKVEEDYFDNLWSEAIRRKTEYTEICLEKIAKYLDLPILDEVWDYEHVVGYEKFNEAKKAIGYEPKYEEDFLVDILLEKGFNKLEYLEYHT